MTCRCCHACGVFATTCVQLGVANAEDSVDPHTGETTRSTEQERYRAGLPKDFRENVAGLLPGMHALAYSDFLTDSPEAAEARLLFHEIMQLEAIGASLRVQCPTCALTSTPVNHVEALRFSSYSVDGLHAPTLTPIEHIALLWVDAVTLVSILHHSWVSCRVQGSVRIIILGHVAWT